MEEDYKNPHQGGVGAAGVWIFFLTMVQSVLLFGLETWAVTPRMGRSLGGFQYQLVIRMTWRIPRNKPDRKWKYTSAATARKEAGLQTMEEYIRKRKNTVTQYISTRSLLDLFEGSERAPGARVGMWWWDQAGINLTGSRKAVAAV